MKSLAETVEDLRQLTKGRIDHDKQIAKFAERAKKLAADTTQLATDLAVFINGNANGVLKETASKPLAERKVKASGAQQLEILGLLIRDRSTLNIAEVNRVVALGPRVTGAALRQLVADGKAIKVGGKFRAVEQPAAADAGASA